MKLICRRNLRTIVAFLTGWLFLKKCWKNWENWEKGPFLKKCWKNWDLYPFSITYAGKTGKSAFFKLTHSTVLLLSIYHYHE